MLELTAELTPFGYVVFFFFLCAAVFGFILLAGLLHDFLHWIDDDDEEIPIRLPDDSEGVK